MPWKDSSPLEQRLALVHAASLGLEPVSTLANRFGVSRKTAHKWIARHAQTGSAGVQDRSHAPASPAHRLTATALERLIALRRAHPTWGPKKLRVLLTRELTAAAPPSERSIARWLTRCGLSHRRPRRARPGPTLAWPGLLIPLAPNDVWTVDFKGAFRTADGQRCEPLTVRDLFSRFILAIDILPNARHPTLRGVFIRLFKRFGLPGVIRVDNGPPFASLAPYGASVLSLWWMRLGIRVDFTRPASPQDNGSHEQFHRVYKAETLRPPACSLCAQARRNQRWLAHYNNQRPHEALGQQTPATLYRQSARRYRKLSARFAYPRQWKVYRVGHKGAIRWRGRVRLLSRVLAAERVGLRPTSDSTAEVYLDKILMGNLHVDDPAGMRPVLILRRKV